VIEEEYAAECTLYNDGCGFDAFWHHCRKAGRPSKTTE